MANSEVVRRDFFHFSPIVIVSDRVDLQVFWLAIPILLLAVVQMSIHRVEEGYGTFVDDPVPFHSDQFLFRHVGVYWRGGNKIYI